MSTWSYSNWSVALRNVDTFPSFLIPLLIPFQSRNLGLFPHLYPPPFSPHYMFPAPYPPHYPLRMRSSWRLPRTRDSFT
ncbi:hypothetical protein EI94DRAFT_1754678 [Lactarius quietus]|nr:hypothetical protein EI94DRAFT_1754678 [Lactarius quietus]